MYGSPEHKGSRRLVCAFMFTILKWKKNVTTLMLMLTAVCQAHLKVIRLAYLQRDPGLFHILKNIHNIDNNTSMQRKYICYIMFSRKDLLSHDNYSNISRKRNKINLLSWENRGNEWMHAWPLKDSVRDSDWQKQAWNIIFHSIYFLPYILL